MIMVIMLVMVMVMMIMVTRRRRRLTANVSGPSVSVVLPPPDFKPPDIIEKGSKVVMSDDASYCDF